MAANWLASFRDLPWAKPLSVAPAIVERGKRLWTGLTNRAPGQTPSVTPATQGAGGATEALAALEVRLHPLEGRVAQIEQEVVSSFEVVNALAEQHSELVRAVDILLTRTRILLRACVLLAISVVALVLLVLVR